MTTVRCCDAPEPRPALPAGRCVPLDLVVRYLLSLSPRERARTVKRLAHYHRVMQRLRPKGERP